MNQKMGFAFIFFVIFSCSAATAEEKPKSSSIDIGVVARVFPSQVTLGEELRLLIRADFPKGFSMQPFVADKLNVKPFEIRSIDKPIVTQKDGRIFQTVTIRLAIYELGEFEVPRIPVVVWNIAGHHGQTYTRPWPVRVVGVPKKKGDSTDIRPIKGQMSFNRRFWLDAGLGLMVVFLTGCLVFLIIVRHRKKIGDLESLLPPEQRASKEMQRLHEKRHILAGRYKEHFSELSDILRRYLERRYGMEIMELTTPETLSVIREKIGWVEVIVEIKEVLQTSDLVKFALYEPEKPVAEESEKKLKDIVFKTTPPPDETVVKGKKK